MKTFDPKNKNLIEIFFENNRYEVPRFQREYAWGMEQIKELWQDIESVSKEDKDSIFFGNFIFLNDSNHENVLSIIDGQQRLTTLQLLLIAIRTRAKTLTSKRNDNTLQISNINNLIEYYDSKFSNKENTGVKKVKVEKSIRPLFDIMADYKWDGIVPEKINNFDGRKYRKIKRKIEPVYSFFFEKVKDLDTQELADLLDALEKIFVTKIEITDPTEAFDIFERTNARGVKLAQSDLVKNLLFQKTEESFHDEVESKWTEIAGNSLEKLSQMLKYYVVTTNGKTLKKEIFPILSARVKSVSPHTLIQELLHFSFFYKMMSHDSIMTLESTREFFKKINFNLILENDSHNKSIIRSISAFQLFNITQIYPLIYSYIVSLHRLNKELEEKNKISKNKKTASEYLLNFIKRLENFHFVNTIICSNIGNQVENLYSDYSKEFHLAKDLNDFIEIENTFKDELLKLRESKKTFVSKFTELSYEEDDHNIIRYIFDRISNTGSKGAQIYPLYNPDKESKSKECNIEHFYPQTKFENESDLIGFDFGHNIGNLLVIPKHSNSKFSSLLPKEKFALIKDELKHLINIGNKEIIITKYVDEEWNQKLITLRASELADYGFEQTWNINI